ncbi:MAG TPA: hypothetical protein VKN18_25400 [Blastocatellia bacterium]|nr:hypothetical protein [Blastocatellia bacterium]
MKPVSRTFLSSLALIVASSLWASAQWNKKPYTEWSEKEALKVLNDSPWGQTQAVTDTSQMTGQARASSGQSRVAEVFNVNIRIRFLSSKPIREAISHLMEMKNRENVSPQMAAQLKAFAAADFPDYIVVTVLTESDKASALLQQTQAEFYKFTTNELKNNTYLQASGQRVFIKEYQPPGKDGLGARYIFPRLVDGKPFVTPEASDVLFSSEPAGATKLKMRYKIKDMMLDGKIEI